MALAYRNGGQAEVVLISRDKTRKCLSPEEFEFLCNRALARFESGHISKMVPFIIKMSLRNRDLEYISLLSRYASKYLLSRNRSAESCLLRQKIFMDRPELRLPDWLQKFDLELIEVKIGGSMILFRKPNGADPYQDLFWCTVRDVFLRNQYDLNEKNTKGKVILDCGANIGAFSLMAAALGAKTVYAFEPVNETHDVLLENIRLNDLQGIIIPIKKAVGNGNFSAEINYDASTDALASINPNPVLPGKQNIDVIKIDDFLKDKEVGFIKMDIEGYEEEALVGAAITIKKFKPVLSISAYHKPTDKTRLPEVIGGIRDDYRIMLNIFGEEDFYCD